jgi:predicted nucleic acid-binding protein
VWVLDCSVALAWGFPDERSSLADHFWSEMDDRGSIWVPAIFWFETANALLVAQRRGRLSDAQATRLQDLYSRLPVRTDSMATQGAIAGLRSTGAGHGLSAYDAAYLELASRRGLGLATLDDGLWRAAAAAGVKVFG